MTKTRKLFTNSLLIFTSIIILTIAISRIFISIRYSIFESNTYTAYFYKFFNFYTLIISFALILIIKKIRIVFNDIQMNMLVFIIPVLIGLLANHYFSYNPSFDSKYCFDIAYALQNGVNIQEALEMYDNYLYLVPYQYGYICFIRLFIILFNNYALSAIKIFQILITGIANIYLYKITILFTNSNIQKEYLLLSIMWIVPYLASPYIYGFSLGIALSIISLYYFILFNRNSKYIHFSIALLLSMFATIIKMNFSILIIAYIIYILIFSTYKPFKRIFNISIIIIAFFISMNSYNILFSLLHNISIPNLIPTSSRLVMTNPGLTEDDYNYANTCNPGFFNGYIYYVVEKNNYDIEKINNDIDNNIDNMISHIKNNKMSSIEYYLLKNIAMWDSYDYLVNTYMTGEYSQEVFSDSDNNINNMNSISNIIEGQVMNIATFTILIFSLLFFIYNKNNVNNEYVIITLWFLGGFLYHFIFEAKPIYVYPYITILVPLASIGINYFNKISSKIKAKPKIFITITSILIICLIVSFYNKQIFTINLFDRDLNRKGIIEINNPITINQYFKIDFDFSANQITIPYEGNLANNNLLINLYENENKLLSFNINNDSVKKNDNTNYISIDFDELCFYTDKTYRMEIVIESISSEFSLIYDDYTYNSSLIIDNRIIDDMIMNFRINRIEQSRIIYYQDNELTQIKDLYYKR